MITSWSPSKLEKYEQCPRRCKLETVDKLCTICFAGNLKGWEVQTCTKCGGSPPQPEVLKRGTLLHKKAEDFITGKELEMHGDLQPVVSWLAKYRLHHKKNVAKVELQLAVDRDWKSVEWFSPKAWLRTKVDVLDCSKKRTWEVVDWKTGKYKPDGEYSDQLNIYSTVVLSAFAQPSRCESSLVFIDAGKGVERPEGTVTRKELVKAQRRWMERSLAMLTDKIFPPKPNFGCRWCPYSKSKGGVCEY